MKIVNLTKGYKSLVSDADFEYLSQFKWNAKESHRTVYAKRKEEGKDVLMHRVLLGITDPNIKVDHEDGDGLNNQRYNLRTATSQQNTRNQKLSITSTSGYKGVTFRKDLGLWNAQIVSDYKRTHLGHFVDPVEAALAYDRKAVELFGEFALTNEKLGLL